jgi:hypothetical protein
MKGYLQQKAGEDIQQEVAILTNSDLDKVPLDCRYLLEIAHIPGQTSSRKYKLYWVRAMMAARMTTERKRPFVPDPKAPGPKRRSQRSRRAQHPSQNINDGVSDSLEKRVPN